MKRIDFNKIKPQGCKNGSCWRSFNYSSESFEQETQVGSRVFSENTSSVNIVRSGLVLIPTFVFKQGVEGLNGGKGDQEWSSWGQASRVGTVALLTTSVHLVSCCRVQNAGADAALACRVHRPFRQSFQEQLHLPTPTCTSQPPLHL